MNKYISLYQEIKDSILEGKIKPNEKLKSKRRMAEALGYSIKTVENAYNLLVDEGYCYTKEKSGYFVSDNKYFQSSSLVETPRPVNSYAPSYDFTANNIDPTLFPYYTFKKITHYIITYNTAVWLTKGPSQGDMNLRLTLADYLYEYKGMRVTANNIIIVSSLEESLDILSRILDIKHIGLENPGYPRIGEYFKDKEMTYYPVDEEGIFLDKDIHQDLIYVTPYNQFPLGVKMSVERRKQLLSYDTDYILEDDFDSDVIQSNKVMSTLYSLNSQKVIYHGSFSHTLCPGLRISYLILPNHLIDRYKTLKTSAHISSFDQTLMYMFIKEGYYYRHLHHIRKAMMEKKKIIEEFLKNNNIIYIEKALSFLLPVKEKRVSIKGIKIHYLSDYKGIGKETNSSIGDDYLILNYISMPLKKLNKGLELLKEKYL